MEKNLQNYRINYAKGQLLETEIPKDPFHLYKNWFEEMETVKNTIEVNAMTVGTIELDGYPRNRVVLLKEFNHEGFIFFTNYNSAKGKALLKNPKICLSFFWHEVERQVIIKGIAEKSSEGKARDYFKSRPRGSQLGAWVSNQSNEIASREVLERSLKELETKFMDKEIPKPEHWGGFLVRPLSFEFWQGRANRLHDRILYKKDNENWHISRLAP